MANFDRGNDFLVWLAGPLPDDVLTASHIHLMDQALEAETDVTDSDPACGFIVRDWFGPFLFSPAAWGMRGRC